VLGTVDYSLAGIEVFDVSTEVATPFPSFHCVST
jgi:hypothetical protein